MTALALPPLKRRKVFFRRVYPNKPNPKWVWVARDLGQHFIQLMIHPNGTHDGWGLVSKRGLIIARHDEWQRLFVVHDFILEQGINVDNINPDQYATIGKFVQEALHGKKYHHDPERVAKEIEEHKEITQP